MIKIKQLGLVLTSSFIISGCSNLNSVLNTENNQQQNVVKNKSETNEKKEYYPDGKLENIIKYQNGIEVEKINYFYGTTGGFGLLKSTYKYNQLVLSELFYKNDTMALVTPYVNGKKEGISKYYNENGKLITEITYSNDQKIKELENEYYNTGELNYIRTIKNDKVEGLVTKYYKNGKIEMQANLISGSFDGEFKKYYENGNYERVNNYVNGKLNGPDIKYFQNGKLQWEVNYINNKEEGTYKEYYPSGQLKHLGFYKNGKLEGEALTYYENGNIKIKAFHKNGNIEGLSKQYFDTGELSWEFYNKNGKRTKAIQYFKGGKVGAEVEYKNGDFVGGYVYEYDGKKTKMTNAHFNNLGLEN